MIIDELNLNDDLEEHIRRNEENFPYTLFYTEISKRHNRYVPWHWHGDVEFVTVLQGNLKLSTNNKSYVIATGEAAYINSNVLHRMDEMRGAPLIYISQVFSPELIAGGYRTVFEQKYVEPVIDDRSIEVMTFSLEDPVQRKLIEKLHSAEEAGDMTEYGYEILVRNALCEAWYYMVTKLMMEKRNKTSNHNYQGNERIKKMMIYIKEHYSEKISLKDIADAASISEREALRCFRSNLSVSPFTYLLRYRCQVAAKELMTANDSLTEISYRCGFSSTSYFGKIFKENMGVAPGEYRKMNKG
ncbi:MAG: AraC family transcriptional regulator [Lachnospiraceae bacterium]|nr:AraC family transcriptional regulator [Lachnospiraceae bacterium]